MAGRGRPKGSKKDKFESLSPEFKDAAAELSTDGLRKKISDLAILNCELRQTLKNDADVDQAKEALGNLMSPYREDFKAFRLQIEFCKQVLDDKGSGATVKTSTNQPTA